MDVVFYVLLTVFLLHADNMLEILWAILRLAQVVSVCLPKVVNRSAGSIFQADLLSALEVVSHSRWSMDMYTLLKCCPSSLQLGLVHSELSVCWRQY